MYTLLVRGSNPVQILFCPMITCTSESRSNDSFDQSLRRCIRRLSPWSIDPDILAKSFVMTRWYLFIVVRMKILVEA